MNVYSIIRKIGVGEVRTYGLDTSSIVIEKVPLILDTKHPPVLIRRD
jgi:hypothetical protein